MLILPAIDIYEGKCVRLRQGQFDERTVYSDSPKAVAEEFVRQGLRHLHVVDLEGAKHGTIKNWDSISAILSIKGARVQIGGGVRTETDVKRLLDLGVWRIVVGSVAVQSPSVIEEWLKKFPAERIAIAVDVKETKLAYSGWTNKANLSPITFVNQMKTYGAKTFVCTDVSRDGMLIGANIGMCRSLLAQAGNIELIACGGVSSVENINALLEAKVSGVVVGKALYEGTISVKDLTKFLSS
ncbi:MAG TPA: 1-(5-phosphoribosyl)-5-[(5-phosphoribosylamino)methylideneamino]imidazole-4-carboxamide isomerase [Bacteroidota bacterium]|nr:1-(5-phosphoribosyl)-5-[(5-phosphoribosylamino)methylideneamino]imidazole-4-carboxamide isomerase [Bacteroidota bacterium]